MGNSSSTPKVSAQDKAVLDLKLQRDKLHQYQKKISYITSREREIAAHHLRANDRPRALLALRRKKYQESLLQKTDQQLAQLEMLCADVEFALVQKDVFFGLQRGTEVLKEIRREMGGVEAVEKLMGDNEEEREYQREISEMLQGRMSLQEEDEVEEELEALERQSNVKVKSGTENGALPNVPAEEIKDPQSLPETPNTALQERPKTKVRSDREAQMLPG